ncbi:peroxidase family protein [Ensifer sp. MJa1]|uniref:peroxidase family protein n=1 Tax=Ensifer sp. MJa1 TaxID=2919888 RepID=UPI003009267C
MAAFKLNLQDLTFILKQIKIAEAHSNGAALTDIRLDINGNVITASTAYDDDGNFIGGPGYPSTDINGNPITYVLAIPDPKTPYGLRTVDGTYNNLVEGRETWGAANQPMPRMFDPNYMNDGDNDTMPFGPPGGPAVTNTDYGVIGAPTAVTTNAGHTGNVADADPRIISNLVVDMSFNNPAAIVAALTFAGSETIHGVGGDLETAQSAVTAYKAALAAIDPGLPAADKLAAGTLALDALRVEFAALSIEMGNDGTLIIPNVAPDEGLSAPFNAWMTFFGQFFDHGLDLISKGNNGTIYVPLQADDPLVTLGPDGVAGTGDEVGPNTRFMALTRATPVTGPDGETTQRNVTTSWVDQNQTYTSHASHQVFLREYALGTDGRPYATGRLLTGDEGGLATWADVKEQALEMLGIELSDRDVSAVPLLLTDPYGEFIRDANGFPQVVASIGPDLTPFTDDDVYASGTPDAPLVLSSLNGGLGPVRTNNAFLDDIAHAATPVIVGGVLQEDDDNELGYSGGFDARGQQTAYDDELLDRHYITGDGRGNENIGLTTVHHIFHSEHNRQVDTQKLTILQSGNLSFINEWLANDIGALPADFLTSTPLQQLAYANSLTWDGERLFQAARFATEMQYQHLVFEEFGRKIQPAIDPFVFNSVTDINPSIFAEFANVVYRFGHSMLTENMPRLDANGNPMEDELGLVESFLNPVLFDNDGAISHDEGAAAIVRGMTIERGNEIDEFITGALRNNLLGLPLDLASINIARARDTGMPTLNQAREQLYAATGSTFLKPYESWVEFAANLKNPMSVINFIAAYGTHGSITGTLEQKRTAAMELVFGVDLNGGGVAGDRTAFLNGTGAWTGLETGFGNIDLWIGGLAEKKMPFGGMLGSTFNAVFEAQLEALQDGDRFYYLTRTQGQNFLNQLEQNSFSKMILANTALADPGADGIRGTADDVISRHIGIDSFANYDFVFEVDATKQADYAPDDPLSVDPTGNDPVMEALGFTKVIRDDPNTPGADVNYFRTFGGEHVVVGGTNGADTIITDFGDDAIWGDDGNDRIESGAGVDLVNGGGGDDIITDSGDTGDFLKGEEGNDVIANSNGLDVLMGGDGKDVVFVGVDDTEAFGGAGDDFILGGAGVDLLMGNEGDDWMEAGDGFDTTAGDNSELFFNSTIKGHDVMFAGSEEHDFDGESGDDIMVQGESVMRNEGMFGFDWAIFKGMALNGYADMRIPIFTTEEEDILRNRFDKVEALSGWNHNDTLMGDDRVAGDILPGDTVATTEGIFFNDELSQAGVNRIEGFRALLGNLVAAAPVGATAAQLEALTAFNSGNILLGGGGSDSLRGNGGDDFLDGDAWLNVRIRITAPGAANSDANEISTVDSLKHVFTATDAGDPSWVGKSLFDLMISRTIVPTQLHIVREVVEDDGAGDTDIAAFNDVRANYTITSNGDGSIRVDHVTVSAIIDPLTERALVSDGVDTVRNVEVLRFSDGDFVLTPPDLRLNAFDTLAVSDTFATNAYNNNSSTSASWANNWAETGDDGSATNAAGQIRVNGGGLRFEDGNGASVQRSVNLTGVTSATLTYSANPDNLELTESVIVEFAADGTNFVLLNTITGNGPNQSYSHTLTGNFGANGVLRFTANNIDATNEVVVVDNVAITFTRPANPVTVDVEQTFTEGSAAISIASEPSITDDVAQMASARIVLTNASAGDVLIVGGLPAGITGAIDTSVAGRITVTLTGQASLAAYQNAIQAVSYRNDSNAPSIDDRTITVTVNDGLVDSNVATSTINVVSVNDAPVAGDDRIVTNNINVPFTIPTWALMADDVDADGPVLAITQVAAVAGLTVPQPLNQTITITDTGTAGGNFNYSVSDSIASDLAQVNVVRDATGTIGGRGLGFDNAGDDIMVGDNAANTIEGAAGNDIIFAGGGDDTINWTAGTIIGIPFNDGRDFVDGGAGTNDRIIINGSNAAEAFVVYAAADAIAAGFTGLKPGTEIVITRDGNVITELDNIEEITINTGGGVDTVTVVGNFNGTSLNFNTITVNGETGNDTVDFSDLQSAHRIVFRSNGGNDTIVGTIRPQDVVQLAPGSDLSTYTMTNNANGSKTLTNGTHSITFTGTVPPQFQNTPPTQGNDEGISGRFEYTPNDLAGLKNLVNGLPAFDEDDDTDGFTGVRTLSGEGNNEDNPGWGSADTPFIRLTDAHYGAYNPATGNNDINPIFAGLDPRNISNILGGQEADLPKNGKDANIFFMAFGQYFDHGLDFLGKGGNGTIQIGAAGGGAPGSGNPADLTRGTVSSYEDGVPQHLNKTSAFVDQNQAYGSNELVGQFLREGDGNGGLGAHLLAGATDPSNSNFKLLPTLRELIMHHWENNTVFHSASLPGGQVSFQTYFAGLVTNGVINQAMLPAMTSNFMGSTHALLLDTNPFISLLDHYVVGDGRGNENFALTSMHTIWARNHNFHVEGLEAAGFDGTAEELYQAAKMINEAEYQRVVFDEFAEMLIGGIRGLGTHGFEEYNPDASAGISHEFAAAVYRVGHSLIGQTMTVIGPDGLPKQVALFDAFLNPTNEAGAFTAPLPPGYVPQPGYEQLGVNAILGGTIAQAAEEVDFNIVDAVRNDLVRISADLFSFNVARGWDVGLGTLNQIRMDLAASQDPYVAAARGYAGDLSPYTSWEDFQARNGLSNTVINQFKQAYPDLVLQAQDIAPFQAINPGIQVAIQANGTGVVKGIDRVDLWVGGLAEKHINDGMVGQTFWIVLHEQFERLQEADRFYYISRFDNFDFYENIIDGQEFADIIARNTGMTDLPEHIFETNELDDEDEDDDDPVGGGDDGDDDDDPVGGDDDDDDDQDDDDDDGCSNGDGDGSGSGDGDGDGTGTPLPVAARTLIGTAAADVLLGGAAADVLLGGASGDILSGDAGNDVLRGEDGEDVLTAGDGDDVASGGSGNDEIHGGAGADMLFGNGDDDLIYGDAGNDVIEGGAGSDRAWGGEGHDTVLATLNDGSDSYWGGEGGDTLDYSVATGNLTVDLGNGFMGRGQVVGTQVGTDTIYGFENFIGGSGHDEITASTAVNVIDGGLGEDVFRFTSIAAADGDTIYGFSPGDRIDFAAIDAKTGQAGVQGFTLKAGTTLTGAGQIVVTHEDRDGADVTVIRGSVDADPDADFELTLDGTHNLKVADFNGVS